MASGNIVTTEKNGKQWVHKAICGAVVWQLPPQSSIYLENLIGLIAINADQPERATYFARIKKVSNLRRRSTTTSIGPENRCLWAREEQMERRNNPGIALLLAISIAIGMLLVSCAERESPSTGREPPSVDVAGAWNLTIMEVERIRRLPAYYSIALDLDQADSIISGSVLTSEEERAQLSARLVAIGLLISRSTSTQLRVIFFRTVTL